MTADTITFLGTGTSTGVPQLRCHCPACTSTDPRDKRLRCSAMVHIAGRDLLIDCGPDFRQQMLLYHPGGDIDALLVTHEHYDHVGGLDDLRPYCRHGRFFPVYCDEKVERALHQRLPYCFAENPYPGVPRFQTHILHPMERFSAEGVEARALRVWHYKLEILAYSFGQRLAYVTDAKEVPQETVDALRGVDTLVINALRLSPHISHMSLSETLEVVRAIAPRRAFLTHISHDMGPAETVGPTLPTGVRLAYDGLVVTI